MATKTISLELDAYEKLRRAKRGGESFSAVVRRARFEEGESASGMVMDKRAGYGAAAISAESSPEYWDRIEVEQRKGVAVESFEAAVRRQEERNRQWKARGEAGTQTGEGRGWTREQLYADRLGEK